MIHHFGPSKNPEKNVPKIIYRYKHFGGEISDIHQAFVGFSACRTSTGALHLGFFGIQTGPVIRGPPVCVVYPHCTVESPENFRLKTLQKRLEMGSNRHSCDLFSKEIMQFCTGEGCPLPNTLVGTMLLFRFMRCKPP